MEEIKKDLEGIDEAINVFRKQILKDIKKQKLHSIFLNIAQALVIIYVIWNGYNAFQHGRYFTSCFMLVLIALNVYTNVKMNRSYIKLKKSYENYKKALGEIIS